MEQKSEITDKRIAFTGGRPALLLFDWKEFNKASIFGSFCYDGQNEQKLDIKLQNIRAYTMVSMKNQSVFD